MLICGAWVRMTKQLTCELDVCGVMNTSGCCCDAPEVMQGEACAELLLHQAFHIQVHLVTSKANSPERCEQKRVPVYSGKAGPDAFQIPVEIAGQVFVDFEGQIIGGLGFSPVKLKNVPLRLPD